MPLAERPIPDLLPSEISRFYESVVIRETFECWPWKATKYYGQFWLRGQTYGAHRISYFLATGEDPYPLLVCHTCDNPPCINPVHLFSGTNSDNTMDCIEKLRFPVAKITPETAEQIRLMYSSGKYTQKEVGAAFGVDGRTINSLLVGHTWKHFGQPMLRPKRVRHMETYLYHVDPSLEYGEKNPFAKLTDENVLEIRERRAQGQTMRGIADCMDTSLTNVFNIVHRNRWKHI